MDDFFLSSTVEDPDAPLPSQKKRKRLQQAARQSASAASSSQSKRKSRRGGDDSDASDDEDMGTGDVDDMNLEAGPQDESENEDDRETAAQKRLRLAKSYLSKVREEAANVIQEGEIDAAQMDRDIIADRLRHDVLESAGRLFTPLAHKYTTTDLSTQIRTFKPSKKTHHQSITSVSFAQPKSTGGKDCFLYSTSKDATIVKWDIFTGRQIMVFEGGLKPTKKMVKALGRSLKRHDGHNDQILCSAVSHDGEFLVGVSFFL
ncbi:pre-rRNA processing protein [Rhizophlyctis rosea]|uniref:Pre-rRNA processing protein n=1 Tax=Rhizophlyctis rosea TaxID=64517 RepID=A0AAD5SAL5_9FUNG|nr:pre-rRNA processing protein [Rhizophlyctis rosea]